MNENRIIGSVELPEGVERLNEEQLAEYEGTEQERLDQALKEHLPNLLATVLFDEQGNPNLDVN